MRVVPNRPTLLSQRLLCINSWSGRDEEIIRQYIKKQVEFDKKNQLEMFK